MPGLTPAYVGGTLALATDAVVGSPELERPDVMVAGSEELAAGEIRVSILGSGLPWVTKSQAAGSVLMEIGNEEEDVFAFDLGAGSLANFSGLQVPITSLKNVFLSHLHGDHVADYLTLMSSYVKMGRIDPVEIWGGDPDEKALGSRRSWPRSIRLWRGISSRCEDTSRSRGPRQQRTLSRMTAQRSSMSATG